MFPKTTITGTLSFLVCGASGSRADDCKCDLLEMTVASAESSKKNAAAVQTAHFFLLFSKKKAKLNLKSARGKN